MIPHANIVAWRLNAPWSTDSQVEQDLVLCRALIEIFSDPEISSKLVFRGGTALHKLFINPPGRYSEDIDLVQVTPHPIGSTFERLRAILNPWLGAPRYKQNEGRAVLIYRFESEVPPITPMRLKIEINTREHFQLLGLQKKYFSMNNPWFRSSIEITTFFLEELLATKLRALYQRKKGRDLFDLSCALSFFPEIDIQKIIMCFKEYMSFEGHQVTRKQFENCLTAKLQDFSFINDIKPLLSVHRDKYHIIKEGEKIAQVLISQL